MEILGLLTLPGWLVGILLFIFSICLYAWYKQTYFTRMGIPQKPTTLLIGDLFISARKGFGYIDPEMVKKYGKCFGTYLGCMPSLMICDADMLKEIMVKHFSSFTDRAIVVPLAEKWHSSVSIANGDRWKFLRQTLSPTFSSGKMRHMCPYIQRCLNNLMEILEEKRQTQGDGFNIDPVIRGYTLDVICTTGFGIDVDSQRNPDNLYIKYIKEFLDIDITGKPLMLLSLLFPDLKVILDKMEVPLVSKKVFDFFETSTKAMFEERKKDTSVHRDLLQLMLNANKAYHSANSASDGHTGEMTYEDYKKRGLTDTDVLINSMIFMSAGFDTTATTLGWLMYDLSLHPEVQDKVIAEIDAKIGEEIATYDNGLKLVYLDMVVNETLRMHPPATSLQNIEVVRRTGAAAFLNRDDRLNRQAVEDIEICGVKIKKGQDCTVCPPALHFMSEYWPEPEKYDPERFSEANKHKINPYAYSPFGNGPRNCIGKRLALLEVKMTLITILQKYKVIRSPKLKVPMRSTIVGLSKAADPLYVKLEPRSNSP